MLDSIRANIRAMAGYTPGEQINRANIVKLNTNENPYPPSPRVKDAVVEALNPNSLRKYPQPLGDTFRQAAGKVLGLNPDSILIGNGSDDILTILTRTFVPTDGLMVSPTPSYVLYKSLAEIQGARFATVPFGKNWCLPKAWPYPEANLTFLPNPNSPSGTALPNDDVVKIATQINGPLVLDEAYADFSEWNGLALVKQQSNIIVTRSFSKYYALAGIRFGFAVASPEIIQQLNKVKDSYNCDVLSLAAATAAIEDQEYYNSVRTRMIATRTIAAKALEELGYTVTPSQANFLWCTRETPLKPVYEALKAQGILVRYMNYAGYGEGLRISVGTDDEMSRLLAEMKTIG